MYMNFDEFLFIMVAVIVGMLIYKIVAATINKVAELIDMIKAKRMIKVMKMVELLKASETAKKKIDEEM